MNKLIASLIAGILLSLCFISIRNTVFADTIDYKGITLTTDGEIRTFNENDDILYIGGEFSMISVNDLESVPRNNIAAISLADLTILPWTPVLRFPVHSIEFQNNNTVLVKNYTDTDEDTEIGKKEAVIDTQSAIIEERVYITPTVTPVLVTVVANVEPDNADVEGLMVNRSKLGFEIPTLSDILTFAIRGFFVISGLAALFFLLLGAFTWVTSGGDKDSVQSAKDKMQAAIVGVLMMVAVLAIVWTLEQVIFRSQLCFGISCPVSLPTLLEPI